MWFTARLNAAPADGGFRRLSLKEYRDKMKGGWIGQIAGVSWGAPTEFKWKDQIIPADKMPKWKPSMINPQGDFDLIVRANGQQLLRKPVSKKTATSGVWLKESLDLSRFAGTTVQLELVNQPTGWSFEAAYWAEIAVHSD